MSVSTGFAGLTRVGSAIRRLAPLVIRPCHCWVQLRTRHRSPEAHQPGAIWMNNAQATAIEQTRWCRAPRCPKAAVARASPSVPTAMDDKTGSTLEPLGDRNGQLLPNQFKRAWRSAGAVHGSFKMAGSWIESEHLKPSTRCQINADCVDGLLSLLRCCQGGTGDEVDALYAGRDAADPIIWKGDDSSDLER